MTLLGESAPRGLPSPLTADQILASANRRRGVEQLKEIALRGISGRSCASLETTQLHPRMIAHKLLALGSLAMHGFRNRRPGEQRCPL